MKSLLMMCLLLCCTVCKAYDETGDAESISEYNDGLVNTVLSAQGTEHENDKIIIDMKKEIEHNEALIIKIEQEE